MIIIVTFKVTVYDISMDFSAIVKSKILNIRKYLMVKDNLSNVCSC